MISPLERKSELNLRIARIVGRTPQRLSRFHTERGDIMPLSAWPDALLAICSRVFTAEPDTPWIVPSAVRYLSRRLADTATVFEFGSGRSTIWYARRVGSVTAVEDDIGWYRIVSGGLERYGLNNCNLIHLGLSAFPSAINHIADRSLDLVVVDSNESVPGDRLECVASSISKVRPGGYLLLDDSDRERYGDADTLLAGWQVRRFVGLKRTPLIAVETSIYQRPFSEISPAGLGNALYGCDEAVGGDLRIS